MANLDFKLIVKIMICFAIVFFIIRHYFDKYCKQRFDYTFLSGTGVALVLGFFVVCMFTQFMLPESLPRSTGKYVLGTLWAATFIGVLVFNIKKTSVPVGLAGTALQFTVLLGAILIVFMVWAAFMAISMALSSTSGGNSYDD